MLLARARRPGALRTEDNGDVAQPVPLTLASPASSVSTDGGRPYEASGADTPRSKARASLVTISDVPEFLRFNKDIIAGYRPHPLTVWESVWSAVGFLHNETANIYTHLLGALVCAYWAFAHEWRWRDGRLHYGVVAFADACSAVCFLGSVCYHTLMSAMPSADAYKRLMTLDVYGIWVVNTGAAVVLTYLLLPCGPGWAHGVLIGLPVLGSLAWIAVVARSPKSRALAFAICWVVRLLSIAVGAIVAPTAAPLSLVGLHLFTEVWPAAGAAINVLRVPEKYAPGRYDFANSHTIMHVCVAVGMLAQHFIGLERARLVDAAPHDLLPCVQADTDTLAGVLPFWL